MAYVKNNNGLEVGAWVTTSRVVKSCAGYFEKGTKVRIMSVSERGYDLIDEHGNVIIETGFDSVKSLTEIV